MDSLPLQFSDHLISSPTILVRNKVPLRSSIFSVSPPRKSHPALAILANCCRSSVARAYRLQFPIFRWLLVNGIKLPFQRTLCGLFHASATMSVRFRLFISGRMCMTTLRRQVVWIKRMESNLQKSFHLLSTHQLMQKLKRYGVAGVLSYGLLNTVYYLTTFLFVWFYFAPAPGRIGYPAAVKRFFKVMAMVWAGSQVTKVLRAAGALALCPFVDRGLSWFTVKFSFESEGKAFAAIAGLCFGLAFLLFLGLTMLWA